MKHLKLIFFLLLVASVIKGNAMSYDNKVQRLSFQTDYFQIKDEFNYGLVTQGVNLSFGYDIQKSNAEDMFSYSADFAIGPGYRQGLALSWHFKPGDFFYGIKVNEQYNVYWGAYLATNYQWQLYPELQSGHMLWFSSTEIGTRIHANFMVGGVREVKIRFSNSILGLVSRPEPTTEKYFYSLKFADFVRNPHSNLKFGSLNMLNHSNLKIELPNKAGKRLAVAYVFDYFGYYKKPKVEYLSHSVNLNWTIGKHNK